MSRLIIIGVKYGQLGNRLYTFSNCIAFAKEHGYRVLNSCFEEYQDLFESTRNKPFVFWPQGKRLFKRNCISRWVNNFLYRICLSDKVLQFLKHFVYILKGDNNDVLKVDYTEIKQALKSKKIIILRSWDLKFDELAMKYKNEICDYFKPLKEVDTKIENRFLSLQKKYDLIIGLHMRKCDYKTHLGGKFYYNDETYVSATRHLSNILSDKRVIFLLFSDEKISPELFAGINTQASSGSAIEDLYSMAKCDFLVGPPSSFTGWASFYGNVPYYAIADINKLPQPEDLENIRSR